MATLTTQIDRLRLIIYNMRGLTNTSQTCFINAGLQCLFAIPDFISRLKSEANQSDISKALLKLSHTMADLHLRQFIAVMNQHTDLVSLNSDQQLQQDAEEFMSKLLDTLHESLSVGFRSIDISETERHLEEALRSGATVDIVTQLGYLRWREAPTLISDIFTGQNVYGSCCESCRQVSCRHQPSRIMTMYIAKRFQNLTESWNLFANQKPWMESFVIRARSKQIARLKCLSSAYHKC